jgi:NAD(P)-dependent dehydrogenase (short-subunit alcohol dehydrogenase family)
MQIAGKTIVVTGAASGIGKAMALRFHAEGAAGIVVADLQREALDSVAAEINGLAVECDVADEGSVKALVERCERDVGPIDIFCSNAGIITGGGENASNEDWQRNWDIHVMGHVYAARAVIPGMIERGGGYLVNTASAAGLLTHIDLATYAVSKHASVAFAEWLSIRYGDQGIRVSTLCPQAVRTAMTAGMEEGVAAVDGMLEPDELAECVVETMAREEFLILPHPQVLDYMQRKTGDYDRWIRGMRRMLGKFVSR